MNLSLKNIKVQILIFIIIAIFISWTGWLLGSLAIFEGYSFLQTIFFIMGGGGPTLAAVTTFFISGQRNDIPKLFDKIKIWEGKVWIIVALLLNFVTLTVVLLFKGDNVEKFYRDALSIGGVGLFLLFIKWFFSNIWEEYGWRGYMLDNLLKVNSPIIASVFVSIAWFIWHLPLFFIEGNPAGSIALWIFALGLFADSFVYTLIYVKQKGSILGVALYHGIANMTAELILISSIDFAQHSFLRNLLLVVWGSLSIIMLLKKK